jgi:hypothetical protein
MTRELKAYEMMKCTHCEAMKDTFGKNLSYCGDCRDDSMKSVLVCGMCEEQEAEGKAELCEGCAKNLQDAAPSLYVAAKDVSRCIDIRSLMVNEAYRKNAVDELVTCEKAIEGLSAAIRKAEGR